MIKLTINSVPVAVEKGATVLQAVNKAGFDVPTMCNNADVDHFASCMVCVVKNAITGTLMPACSATVQDGMQLLTQDDALSDIRKTAVALLMSEHVGDCEAPCRVACPAYMDIPTMNRLIASGDSAAALAVVRRDIALPGILGHICPAPCEGVCRRKPIDQAVSICLLKRFAAESDPAFVPTVSPEKNLTVCVVGAGPAGLSAAYYLRQRGYRVDVYDNHPLPGGSLRYALPAGLLEASVLDADIATVLSMGVRFFANETIEAVRFKAFRAEYPVVVVATGTYSPAMSDWGLENDGKQLIVDKTTYQTNLPEVFCIGNTNRTTKLAIRSAAQGKEVAFSVDQYLKGEPVCGEPKRFNSTIGRLVAEEFAEYMRDASPVGRHQPVTASGGFDPLTAASEAVRCMDCDCRKADACQLRNLADHFKLEKKRYVQTERVPVRRNAAKGLVVFEPGKCIKCGICVRMTALHGEAFGFTFIGRGFNVEVGVPFNENIGKALEKTANIVIEACPTGALAHQKNTR